MIKAILFNFNMKENNERRYIVAMELAKALDVALICFTQLPKEASRKEEDEVYLYLLKLNGIYQTHINHWRGRVGVDVKNVVEFGKGTRKLNDFLRREDYELIPVDIKSWTA